MKTGSAQWRKWRRLSIPLLAAVIFGGWTFEFYPYQDANFARSVTERQASREIARAPSAGIRHTKEFKTTGIHGSQFLQNKDACRTCHGEDLRGGSSQKSCTTCHRALELFDHFGQPRPGAHGAAFLKSPESCAGCHGSDWKGKDGAFGCLDCHNFPHAPGWALPDAHGTAYLDTGRSAEATDPANCLYCHSEAGGFDERHPDRFLNCASCHPVIPHPNKNWIWGKHHAEARNYEGKCLHCHTDMKRLMPNMKKGCGSCHKGTKLEPVMKFLPKGVDSSMEGGAK